MRARAIVAGAVMAVLLVGGATQALARDGDVIRQGACSGAADWKKLSNENGRIEVEYEVDRTARATCGGSGSVTTVTWCSLAGGLRSPPSGSFTVRILQRNRAGDDVFRGRAVNLRTGQICGGRAV